MNTLTYLTLILVLSTGEVTNTAMKAHDCYAAAATMHHAWSVGGRVDRDDGVLVTGATCAPSTLEEIHAIESEGLCEMEVGS